MKLLASLVPLASAWPKYTDTIKDLTGTTCDWQNKSRGVYSAEVSCVEGDGVYQQGDRCTLQCPEGKVPTFAQLECKKGEFHPPGFLTKFYWDDNDIATDFQVYCTTAAEIPAPGIKRGMSIWNTPKQHEYYNTYNTVWHNETDYTIGWFYTWNTGPAQWAFRNEFAHLLDEKSHYWPIYAYPPCSEATHPTTGDGSCDPATCNDSDTCTGNRYSYAPYGSYAESYMGIFNEPYGSSQAHWSPTGTLSIWETEIEGEIAKLAAAKDISADEIKIVGPSIAHKTTGMNWANTFYPAAKEAGIKIDYLNLHAYQMHGHTVGGPCLCDAELLRDQLSHLYTKYELPIWLTEFNCGNGYWNCPLNEHTDYMTDTLPMLEEHPFVPRYNWMSALTENDVEMNERDTYQLNDLGRQYNQYHWDEVPRHNPQWTQSRTSKWSLTWYAAYFYSNRIIFTRPWSHNVW